VVARELVGVNFFLDILLLKFLVNYERRHRRDDGRLKEMQCIPLQLQRLKETVIFDVSRTTNRAKSLLRIAVEEMLQNLLALFRNTAAFMPTRN